MSNFLVDDMDTAWTSSNAANLQVTVDTQTFFGAGTGSNRMVAGSGALNASADFVPGASLDLSAFEEFRFWIRSNRHADGSPAAPFYLEFSYVDVNDPPGEEHRWFVPINQSGTWEQRRIGITGDRRSAITRLRFRCLTSLPFTCHIDELLAVRDEMILDLELTLAAQLDRQIALPGLTNIPLSQTANPNDSQIVLPLTLDVVADNRILIRGGTAGDETHDVTGVNHDTAAGTTTLFLVTNTVVGTLNAGVATVTVIVPLLIEAPPSSLTAPRPALIATALDVREDMDRTAHIIQRDSFRPRGALTMCSVRPAARAYVCDYQITAVAPNRAQQRLIHLLLLQRLSIDIGLRINGVPSPVWILPPPVLERREFGVLASAYVRIGTRMETAPRQERPWVRRAEVETAPLDAPFDHEGIVIEL